ncbi:MAG: hypothetical protein LUF85_11950 [Bacteroides sp.]|nr:hypothetical protein [Bacteroides sp.]
MVVGLCVPDVITLDILGIPDGFTILTAGADISLWEVQLSQSVFDLIAGSDGSTVEVEVEVIPGVLVIRFIISVVPCW